MKTSRIITSQRKRVAKKTLVELLSSCIGGFFLSDILIFTAVALILTIAPAAGQKSEPAVSVPKYVRRPSHFQSNSGRNQPSSSAIRMARRSASSLERIG
ncbi:MAG: hypothetical protein WBZ01_01300 [Terriglobales bacterium]|jgi:hypothetical protein